MSENIKHFIYVFMFTIDEDRPISRYLDSGGHFGFSHDMGVPDFF